MNLQTILLWLFAAGAVFGALSVVVAKHPLRAALGLLLNFLSLGLMFLLLNASFIAMAQIIVYAGGVAVFILMAISLLGLKPVQNDHDLSVRGLFSIMVVLALLMGAIGVLYFAHLPQAKVVDVNAALLGQALMGPFLLAFELASILLIIGMVAAVVISRNVKEEDK